MGFLGSLFGDGDSNPSPAASPAKFSGAEEDRYKGVELGNPKPAWATEKLQAAIKRYGHGTDAEKLGMAKTATILGGRTELIEYWSSTERPFTDEEKFTLCRTLLNEDKEQIFLGTVQKLLYIRNCFSRLLRKTLCAS